MEDIILYINTYLQIHLLQKVKLTNKFYYNYYNELSFCGEYNYLIYRLKKYYNNDNIKCRKYDDIDIIWQIDKNNLYNLQKYYIKFVKTEILYNIFFKTNLNYASQKILFNEIYYRNKLFIAENCDKYKRCIFEKACNFGDYQIAKKLISIYNKFNVDKPFLSACLNGNILICNYLLSIGIKKKTYNFGFYNACSKDKLQLCLYLYRKNRNCINFINEKDFIYLYNDDRINVVKWLYKIKFINSNNDKIKLLYNKLITN